MFAFLEGKLEWAADGLAVINCSGVGYEVNITDITLASLPPAGSFLRLYTFVSVNENSGVTIYGMISREELEMFKVLITVNGVGPKAALSILSALDTDTLRFAILSGDSKKLSSAPGVGKKIAERIILELKDRIDFEGIVNDRLTGSAAASSGLDNPHEEAVLALVSLGYSRTESLQAVGKAQGETVDEILKEALKKLI